jgi:hypothetical protein
MFSEDQLKRKDIDTLRRWLSHKLGGYIIAVKDMPQGQRLYRGECGAPRDHKKLPEFHTRLPISLPFDALVGPVSQNSIAAQAVPRFL